MKGKLHWGPETGDGNEMENTKEKKSKLKLPKKDARAGCNEHQRNEEVVRKAKQKTVHDTGKQERMDGLDEMLREVLKGISRIEKSNKILSKKIDAMSNDFKENRRSVEACLERAGLLSGEKGRKEQRARDQSIPSFDLGLDSDKKNEVGECSGDVEVNEGKGEEYGVVAELDVEDYNPHISLNTMNHWRKVVLQMKDRGDKALGKAHEGSERAADPSELQIDVEKENADVIETIDCGPNNSITKDAGFKDTFETPTRFCEVAGAPNNEATEVAGFNDTFENPTHMWEVYNPNNDVAALMDDGEETNRPRRESKAPKRFTPRKKGIGRVNKRPKTDTCMYRVDRLEEEMFKGPFTEDPDEMPPKEAVKTVEDILCDGLLRNHIRERVRKYYAGRDKMDPLKFKPLYGLEATLSKSWYYKLFFSWAWLDDEHMQVVFYYLRMKGIEFGFQQKYTTTDPSFLTLLNSLYQRYLKQELTIKDAARNGNMMGTIVGGKLEFGRPWAETEFVYMPLGTDGHWTLLVLSIREKMIRVYDSKVRRGQSLRNIHTHLPCLQTFLPKIMDRLGVYGDKNEAELGDTALRVEGVPNCPQQVDGSSCGIFVVKFAEYLMMGKDVGGINAVKIDDYRKKMTVELMNYASLAGVKK
ncbi:unnamed protein product [Cuscuta campestris]|uniref:Ubiquitin-like protease family profile domain-containing protein n=1 Tax=Cuscuta campestris TaxID=132261 RepID=A0A484KQV5_9ASTE|nr:unnamed protein product [Cuscuta campestris]